MQESYEQTVPIVVVGAGPVGLVAALAARHADLPVIVVEKAAEDDPRSGSRATYLFRESLDFLEGIAPGVAKELVALSGQWGALRTTYRGKTVYTKTFVPAPPGAFGVSVQQPEQEKVLRKRCIEEGVQFRWSDGVTDAKTDSHGVTLTLESGNRLCALYVVAADGARSAVRSSLGGMDLEGERSETGFIIVDAEASDQFAPELNERAFHYNHPAVGGRNVLIVPFGGGLRIDLQCFPEDDIEQLQTPEELKKWVSAVAGEKYADKIIWSSTYRFNRSVASNFTDRYRRVLLAGEAAHLFPPFGGGRGLNSGIPDAVLGVEAIAEAIRAGNSESAEQLIDAVAKERRSAALANRKEASKALVRMEARTVFRRLQRFSAATLAPWWKACGIWLDRSPTGGSIRPVTTRSRF